MRTRIAAHVVVLALLALAGCETAPPAPPPPVGAVPDLRGTWTGTWGGAPLTLVVTDQDDIGDGGVYVGPWQVFGRGGPGLSGVLTSTTARGDRTTLAAVGRLGSEAGRLVVLLHARGAAGDQRLRLAQVGPDRLQGMGESTYRWGPGGPAELVRQPAPPR